MNSITKIKNKKDNLERIKFLKGRLSEEKQKNSELNEQIDDLNKKLKDLEDQLSSKDSIINNKDSLFESFKQNVQTKLNDLLTKQKEEFIQEKQDIKNQLELTNLQTRKSLVESVIEIFELSKDLFNSREDQNYDKWFIKFNNFYERFAIVLTKNKIKPMIVNIGDRFDDKLHKPLNQVENANNLNDLIVSKVIQIGYFYEDIVIKDALVYLEKKENQL